MFAWGAAEHPPIIWLYAEREFSWCASGGRDRHVHWWATCKDDLSEVCRAAIDLRTSLISTHWET